jgi:nitrilase
MKVYVLQMCSSPNVKDNLLFVQKQLLDTPTDLTNAIVVLPECFAAFGAGDSKNLDIAEPLDDGRIQTQLASLARQYSIYLVAGTFPILKDIDQGYPNNDEGGRSKVRPMTLVYSPKGALIAHYQKIHLFDVDVEDGIGSYRESDNWQAGDSVVCFDTPFGKVGLAICYDLRFPGLFQTLRDEGVDVVLLPSAFTEKTGAAHWQVLLQARAIENQFFMVGCNQAGVHENGRETFGHSMIIDPWGTILLDAQKELGVFGVNLKLDSLINIRQSMPVQKHNKFVSRFNDK